MNDLLTIQEVAQHLRITDATVRKWIKRGLLESVALPCDGAHKTVRIPRSALDRALQSTARER